ncbi:MAG: hypothetical protein WEB87_01090 [Bacteriovoracaceae bacterium]
MPTLINKSNHPVNIKKINIRVWTLRDEIEACIQKRIEEQGVENVDIEDIKNFYSNLRAKNNLEEDELDDNVADMNVQPGIADTSELEESEDQDDPETKAQEEDQGEEQAKAREMADEVLSDSNSDGDGSGDDKNSDAPPAGFKRVKPPKEKMVYGFAFLSEVHMDQILFFGKRPYTTGQSIIVEFLIPNKFSLSAEVVHSLHIDRRSKIISETKPSHRVQSNLTFLFDGERGSLRDFLKSVEPPIPPPPKKLKRPDSGDDDDDDFDDLGF